MPTLSETLASWRTAHQSGDNHQLMSILTIDGQLYDIKDPALDAIIQTIESRLSNAEDKNVRDSELTKGAQSAKFVTEITQGVQGAVTVTYGDAETTDVKRSATAAVAGQAEELYTAEDQALDPSHVQGTVKTPGIDPQIALSGTTTEAALIELAKAIAIEKLTRETGDSTLSSTLIGSSSDASTANTIAAAKKYADEAVANLAGTDWEQNAKKVQEIIAELENAENANAWATAIDKLAGLGVKTEAVYYQEGDPEVEAGTAHAGEVRTPAVYNTVKDYVDAAIVASQFDVTALDATVRGNLTGEDGVQSGHKVGVKVIEQDGVITSVTVVEDDIASAAALAGLQSAVEDNEEVTAAALVDLDTRVTGIQSAVSAIDLTTKANKAAFGTQSINQWTTQYDSTNETLIWSSAATDVYVPVGNQSL